MVERSWRVQSKKSHLRKGAEIWSTRLFDCSSKKLGFIEFTVPLFDLVLSGPKQLKHCFGAYYGTEP